MVVLWEVKTVDLLVALKVDMKAETLAAEQQPIG